MPEKIRTLIIEADPETVRSIDFLGRQTGVLDLRWRAASVGEGADLIRENRPDLAIVGVNGDPTQAISTLSGEFPGLYLLALAATDDADYVLRAMRAGAHDLIRKPVKEMDLRIAAEKALRLRSSNASVDRNGEIVTVTTGWAVGYLCEAGSLTQRWRLRVYVHPMRLSAGSTS